eukprot:TRINITY_DN2888_c0_g1_i1.p1 TRINITY_DN2888_c0_g1~~TRINITY_DN2888_c0_g1_i1.p1  ORF type:complete len:157 (+),score=55.75 TRINITY_DN2888_c0_g1_i1:119-589(+)
MPLSSTITAAEPTPPVNRVSTRLKAGDIDREKTCPLLMRVFWKFGDHQRLESFERKGKETSQDEFQIHTWKDATLRELTELVKEVNRGARTNSHKISFAWVYPDIRGKMTMRNVGYCWANPRGKGLDINDDKTLDQLGFVTGDYVSVSITRENDRR